MSRLTAFLRVLVFGNTEKIKDVMPEETPPLKRSLWWGLQIFLDASAATVVGVIVINELLKQKGVTERLDPQVALIAAGVGTLLWLVITGGKMPNFLGTSFTYITVIAGITAAMKGTVPGENPIAYATGAVILSSITTVVIALLVGLLGRIGGGSQGGDFLYRVVPKPLAAAIVVIIGASLASVATGMLQKDLALGLTTLLLAMLFRFLPGYWGTIPLILSVGVMYIISIVQGRVDPQTLISAPLLITPNFIAPRFNLLGFVQMMPVSLATSFETLGHLLVLERLLARPLMSRLWLALLADAACDTVGGAVGAPGNTTYAEVLGLFSLTRVFSNVAVAFAAFWAILFGFSGHLNALLTTIPEPVIGGVAVLTFGMIIVPGLQILVTEAVNYGNLKVGLTTAAMMIFGLGNARLVLGETEWLSGISFAIVAGLGIWWLLSAAERLAQSFWAMPVEKEVLGE